MKLAILILLPSLVAASAAMTEKYVSADGGGSHDGSDEVNAFSWSEMITDINAGGKAGNRYNVKQGSITVGANTISGSGATNSPIVIRGYKTTIGDGYLGRTNANNGLITNNFPQLDGGAAGQLTLSGHYIVVESMAITGSKNANLIQVVGFDTIHWCSISNAATYGNDSAGLYLGSVGGLALDCDISLSNNGFIGNSACSGSSLRVISCRIRSSNIGACVDSTPNSTALISGCQIYNCVVGVTNMSTSAQLSVVGSTITGCTDGIGVLSGATTGTTLSINNLIADNSGVGIRVPDCILMLSHNRFRNNGSNFSGSADWVLAENWGGVTSGAVSDFQNASTTDFRLVTGSPARGVGTLSYRDIGGVQSSSSGGSFVFAQ